jgi:hypothetical protein
MVIRKTPTLARVFLKADLFRIEVFYLSEVVVSVTEAAVLFSLEIQI